MSEHGQTAGLLGKLLGDVEVNVFAAKAIMLLCGQQEKFVWLFAGDFLDYQGAIANGGLQVKHISDYLAWLKGGIGSCYWEKYFSGETNPNWQRRLEELSKEHRAVVRAVMIHLRDCSPSASEGRFEVRVEDVHQLAAQQANTPNQLDRCRDIMDELVQFGLLSGRQVGGSARYGLRLQILRFLGARLLARIAQ